MIKELVLANRSYRSFDRSVKISKEKLCEWVDIARITPSTMNRQAMKFKICYTEQDCEKCLSLVRFAGALKIPMPPKGHEPVAYIIIAVDTDIAPNYTLYYKDTGIVAQTIMLAAAEEGFGGCMLGSGAPEKIAEAFELPENIVPSLVLALGKPDEQVELCGVSEYGNVMYYRDESNTHFVPKRSLEDILI